jgi:hypothetical protein
MVDGHSMKKRQLTGYYCPNSKKNAKIVEQQSFKQQ